MKRTEYGYSHRGYGIHRHEYIRDGFLGRWTVKGFNGHSGFGFLRQARSFIDFRLDNNISMEKPSDE